GHHSHRVDRRHRRRRADSRGGRCRARSPQEAGARPQPGRRAAGDSGGEVQRGPAARGGGPRDRRPRPSGAGRGGPQGGGGGAPAGRGAGPPVDGGHPPRGPRRDPAAGRPDGSRCRPRERRVRRVRHPV
ncbi:MAG: hypothetical protein AVDCRST_MAG72-504, partial [uncultured Nocardioidaceae bacterium]